MTDTEGTPQSTLLFTSPCPWPCPSSLVVHPTRRNIMAVSPDAGCSMLLLRGYRAVALGSAAAPPDCRRQRLPATSFEECASACLAQPFCEAATWFGQEAAPTLREMCVGRTAGSPSEFAVDTTASVAFRTCEFEGCGLQARLDELCRAASVGPKASPACRGSTVARNRRVLGGHDARLEDYHWVCAPPVEPPHPENASAATPTAAMLLACVDDRGAMAPCGAPRDVKQASLNCWPTAGGDALHDLQRAGCPLPDGSTRCLATPGSGWPVKSYGAVAAAGADVVPPPPLPHWVRPRRGGGAGGGADSGGAGGVGLSGSGRGGGHGGGGGGKHGGASARVGINTGGAAPSRGLDYSTGGGSEAFAAAFAAAASASGSDAARQGRSPRGGGAMGGRGGPARRLSEHAAAASADPHAAVDRLRRLGYLNCSMTYDELKDGCAVIKGDAHEWLQYAWTHHRGGSTLTEPGATADRPSQAAREVSWWLPRSGGGAAGADPFDAEAFLRALAQLRGGGGGSVGAGGEHEVLFVGDSTARQQTVSLCCLLRAGTVAAGGAYRVTVTKALPYMDFKCRVHHGASGRAIASVSFLRFMRADSLPTWRPAERTPRLSPVLASAIARAPALLSVNLGAWEYEDGCIDMHSLHDGICNGTRPWILREYAAKWMLLAAATRASYLGRGGATPRAARSLVVWRAATPRDFEGGVAKHGGRCRRRAPIHAAELAGLERTLDPASMRFAVLTKNLIMDSVARQRLPWVRVLDAYAIARQRADAHPGPDPKTNRKGSLHPRAFDDCLHYCLPGVPDLYNGRLLALLLERIASGNASAAPAASAPAPPAPPGSEGAPGTLTARWNFAYGGAGLFVQGRPPDLALQLEARGPPSPLECTLPSARGGLPRAGSGRVGRGGAAADLPAAPPLLGFCSDLDPPASFTRRHGRNTSLLASARGLWRTASAELAGLAAAARRASKASLLTKAERESLREARPRRINATNGGGGGGSTEGVGWATTAKRLLGGRR